LGVLQKIGGTRHKVLITDNYHLNYQQHFLGKTKTPPISGGCFFKLSY
jgi:hypothetical protein